MRECQRQWHISIRLTGSISEHHSLITCSLFLWRVTHHSLVDIRRLFMYGREYTTRVGFEHIITLGIAYSPNHITSDLLYIEISFGFHFSGKDHLSGGY